MNFEDPVIFDIETPGGQISQIAALCPASGDRFEVKVHIKHLLVPPSLLTMCHYDHAVWEREAVSAKVARKRWIMFLERHRSIYRVVKETRNRLRLAAGMGYNAQRFDHPMLKEWLDKRHLVMPMDNRIYDVLQLALWCLPSLENYQLGTVASALGVGRARAHDAMVDVEMTTDVAAILLHRVGCRIRWVAERFGDDVLCACDKLHSPHDAREKHPWVT